MNKDQETIHVLRKHVLCFCGHSLGDHHGRCFSQGCDCTEERMLTGLSLWNDVEDKARELEEKESECRLLSFEKKRLLACEDHRRNLPIEVNACDNCIACLKLLHKWAMRDKQS